jgi:beta-galactosidase
MALKVVRVDSTEPARQVMVKGGGAVSRWRERVETTAEVLLTDEEDFPVLVAQGRLHYLAASADKALMQRIIDKLLEDAGIAGLTLPAGVRCRVRGGYRIYFNYGASPARLTKADDEGGYVLGGADITPAGVTIARLAKAG